MNTLALITTAVVGCGASCHFHIKAISPVEEVDDGWKRLKVENKRYRLMPDGEFRQLGRDPRQYGNYSSQSWTFAHCEDELVAHSASPEMKNLKTKTIWRRREKTNSGLPIPDMTSVNFSPFGHWYQICDKEFHQNYPRNLLGRDLRPHNIFSFLLQYRNPDSNAPFIPFDSNEFRRLFRRK